jgi:hypothetical protein
MKLTNQIIEQMFQINLFYGQISSNVMFNCVEKQTIIWNVDCNLKLLERV